MAPTADTHIMVKVSMKPAADKVEAHKALFAKKAELSAKSGALYCFCSWNENHCVAFEGFATADVALQVMKDAADVHKELGAADAFEVHGPKEAVAVVAAAVEESGCSKDVKRYVIHPVEASYNSPPSRASVLLCPYFKVHKQEEFVKQLGSLGAASKGEEGMHYYAFTNNGTDSVLCREGYKTGEDVLVHLGNVGAILGEILSHKDVCEIAGISAHGPKAELDKTAEALAGFNTAMFYTD
eukprot:Rhum_TRINITY_DN23177_c0_g1::Rhum_TRINITY_DN23177_c0_g1_i1::g.177317::m.177317